MKLNNVMIAVAMTLGMTSIANANSGTVSFKGSIVEAPCSIDPTTVDQTVELGNISNAQLAAGSNTGESTPKNFYINLENCNIGNTPKTISATFTGADGGANGGIKGSLGVTGSAKGASIIMTDGTGKQISLGDATTPQGLQDGNNKLAFAAYLKGHGGTTITPGNFSSVANFTLSYQ